MKPIICNSESVRAILDGRKTQTRRVIKPQPLPNGNNMWHYASEIYAGDEAMKDYLFHEVYGNKGTPYGSVYGDGTGDKLWVRETWASLNYFDVFAPSKLPDYAEIVFKATDEEHMIRGNWRASIHLPKKFSRITLEIKDVRVERMQDISDLDIFHEGLPFWADSKTLPPPPHCYGGPAIFPSETSSYAVMLRVYRKKFEKLWNSINAKKGFGWDTNPWVWVIEFEKL